VSLFVERRELPKNKIKMDVCEHDDRARGREGEGESERVNIAERRNISLRETQKDTKQVKMVATRQRQ
jgi:hypothetical protein